MSILGHLAGGLGKEENVATKGLAYVLREKAARDALAAFLVSCGASAVGDVDYSTQDGDHENGIPDLVGRSGDGQQRVVLEGKFGAGLTKHQPVSYLNTLAQGGVLAFIVPEERMDYVWRVMVKRSAEASLTVTEKPRTGKGRCATVGPNAKELLVVGWAGALSSMGVAAKESKQDALDADVEQLKGLCEQMGKAGFTPLLPEELTSGVWGRILPLSNLVDEIGKVVVSESIAVKDGRLSHEPGSTTLKFKMHELDVWLCFDANACWQHYATPFWLLMPPTARAALAAFGAEEPRRLFESEGRPYLALPIRTGVERDEVVSDVVEACREAAGELAKHYPRPATTSTTPPQAPSPPSP